MIWASECVALFGCVAGIVIGAFTLVALLAWWMERAPIRDDWDSEA